MAISYDIEHKPTGGAVTLVTGVTGSPEVIAGLVAESGYEWRIRQVDTGANGAVIYSYWSAWTAFTTAVANVDIDITFDNVNETGSVGVLSTGDVTPPVITLVGDTLYRQILGQAFTDPGATATDDNDGNITGSITFTDNIDVNSIGKYQRTYDCVDAVGNSAVSVVRDIHVNVPETPVSYNVNYREVGQATVSLTGITSSPEVISSLIPGTNYEFQVQAVGSDTISAFTAWTAFATSGVSAEVNMTFGAVTESSTASAFSTSIDPGTGDVEITFPPVVGGASTVNGLTLAADAVLGQITPDVWDVEFRNDSTLAVTSYPFLAQKSLEVTGLTASSGYSFRVRGKANSNTLNSEWTEWLTFSTTAVGTIVTPIYSQNLDLEVFSIVIDSVTYADGNLVVSGTSTQEALALFTIAGESFYKRVYAPTWSFTKTLPNTDLLSIDTLDEFDEYDGASYYLLEGADQVTGVDGILF